MFNIEFTVTEFSFVVTGVLIIIYGIIILTGKKFMIKGEYNIIFAVFITILFNAIRYIGIVFPNVRPHNIISVLLNGIKHIKWGEALSFLDIAILPVFVCILAVMINIGRYTLTNVNSQMLLDTLTEILKENGISYEEAENSVILKDFDNKIISYTQSLNSVEINLRDIRKTSFYKELKKELGCRI